MQFVLIPAP